MIRTNSKETRAQARDRIQKSRKNTFKKGTSKKETIVEACIRKYGKEKAIAIYGEIANK